jgi:2-polyprenyl-3-methyl-5-hydroxy-6-metoxy-1,4-benzoquinol methylase
MDEMNPLPLQNLRVADIGCGGGILSEVGNSFDSY